MCSSLLQALNVTDPSSQLLETMASSLLQSYDPNQVIDPTAVATCSKLLAQISRLSLKYLGKSDAASLPGTIAKAISLFLGGNSSSTTSSESQLDAINAVKDLTEGVLKSLVGGQTPTQVVAGGVRTNVQKSLPRCIPNIVFQYSY